MTGLELLVIAVGAPAGYWLVNFLSKSSSAGDSAQPVRHADGSTGDAGADTRHEEPPDGAPDAPPRAWHEVLELRPDAGAEDIRAAYRRLLSQYHPDKVAALGPELRALATRKSQEITSAYRQALHERGATS